ncbi:MFS general substrate transporter [Glarea lozoyensis ATCC 20868]|uniref:MFS general substrate transporter n=1 Tax=Glarea lozoyensis (strain ATCC 20868 / MF5171) TaxID=1116229 RepID=S3E3I7_GLAL2|nr:MFS general substrate transporter [Glarea lozoyensis ATCC 20868]EPE33003.1 MFS general substrate transporter [Glarea lozoyensis ATCC 20868]
MDVEPPSQDVSTNEEPPIESDTLLESQAAAREGGNSRQRLLISALPALLLCTFLIRFDGSFVIGNYSRRIALDLHDFKNARWLVLGFLVTESACGPLYGHAAQVYGHRNAILFAATAMCIGLFLCSVSYRLWQVSLARVVVGTGTAGVELLVVIIINDFVQLYELPLWTSLTTFFGTIGLMLGGPLGAVLADHLGFRSTFGIESSFMAIALVFVYLTLKLPESRPNTSNRSAKKIEYLSSSLLLLSVAVPLFALNLGGEVFKWGHPVVITMFCLSPFLVALFYYADTRLASTPIVPKRFVQDRNIAIALACTLPMKFVFDQLRFSFGTYLQARSFGKDSSFDDWALTCVYLGRALGTIGCGLLIKRYRRFKPYLKAVIIVDLIIYFCFALGVMQKPKFAPILAFIGATEGFAEGLWLVAILSLVDAEDQPLLYAFFGLSQAVSGDLGIAISLAAEGTLVRSKLHAKLSGYANAEEIIRKSLEDLNYIKELPVKVQTIVLNALISSTEIAFAISFLVLMISLFFSFYIKEMPRAAKGVSYIA